MTIFLKTLFSILLFLLVNLSVVTDLDAKDTLTIGRASDNINQNFNRLFPIADYLASRLEDVGIKDSKVLLDGENSNRKIIGYLNSGAIDLVLESPFSAAEYQKHSGAYPLLMVEREGLIEYCSFIFVHKKSTIKTLSDLRGKVIAFEDPTSTSSYRWPANSFAANQLPLISTTMGAVVPADMVGYIFAGSELNISSYVFYGKTAAGALSSADWRDPEETPESYKKDFRIIHTTKYIPRMVVMARKDLPTPLVERLRKEMLEMHTTKEGKAALMPYRIDRFWPVPDDKRDLLSKLANQ